MAEMMSFYLDITQELCPMTFVRTKLLIEAMPEGAVCEVRLRGAEPLKNVPRSARDHGHTVIDIRPEGSDDSDDAVHLVRIRKSGS
jgi:tRNA 2-thiouridine synthesizing protein A